MSQNVFIDENQKQAKKFCFYKNINISSSLIFSW